MQFQRVPGVKLGDIAILHNVLGLLSHLKRIEIQIHVVQGLSDCLAWFNSTGCARMICNLVFPLKISEAAYCGFLMWLGSLIVLWALVIWIHL